MWAETPNFGGDAHYFNDCGFGVAAAYLPSEYAGVSSGRWPVLAALVAVLVALTLPAVSGIVLPAAIVVVAIAALRKPAAK